MTIAFVHPHYALLPELDAYKTYFENKGIHTVVIDSADIGKTEADIEWHFMGIHRKKKPSTITIHEYGSASVPPLAAIKDRFKKIINVKPDYRVFFSEYVREKLLFNDEVPYGFRDHGVPRISPAPTKKEYDFIYAGSVERKRNLSSLFKCFVNGPLRDKRLLVLSRDYENLFTSLGKPTNIEFKGPVKQEDVYHYIQSSQYALNFIPDIQPFNNQTSSKFIDYAACMTPIITSDYAWVRNFQEREGKFLSDNFEVT